MPGPRQHAVGILTALSVVLAACSGGSASTTSSGPGQTAGGGGAASGGGTTGNTSAASSSGTSSCSNVELTYWNGFSGPDGAFMKTMVDQYNALDQNKGKVNVKVTTQPFPQYYEKISAAQTSDSLPDVLIVHLDQLATWAARGALQPVDDVVKQIGLTDADYPAPVWQGREYKGKRYGIPLDIHPMSFYWNTRLLQQAGISEPPKDAAAFEAAAQKLTQGNVKGYIQPLVFPAGPMADMLLYQNGGRITDEQGSKATFNTDAGRKALDYMLKLKNASFSTPDVGPDAEANAFQQGTNAMTLNGIWMILGFRDSGVEFDAGPVPQLGSEMKTWANSHNLTLPVHKKGEDACKMQAGGAFIGWVTQNAATWAQGGQVPARVSARNSPEFKALKPQANIAAEVDSAVFPPPVPGITDAVAAYEDAAQAVLSGKSASAAALADAEKKANDLLTQNKQKYQ